MRQSIFAQDSCHNCSDLFVDGNDLYTLLWESCAVLKLVCMRFPWCSDYREEVLCLALHIKLLFHSGGVNYGLDTS